MLHYNDNSTPSLSSLTQQIQSDKSEKNGHKCPFIYGYDDFRIFVDNGNQKSLLSTELDDWKNSIIPGKTADGDIRYPAYKLEYDVFWALRLLANNISLNVYSVSFTFAQIQKVLSRSNKTYFTNRIQKSLEILATAKFQVKNSKGKVKEYSYIKELCMPTRKSKGLAVFDDAILEGIKSGNYRQINVKKLLSHTTAGGRYLYQRMNMKFTQASENINSYILGWHKILRDTHRKSEFKKHSFEYLKTVARDLRDNGTINITEEQIKNTFSAKATKHCSSLYFPVSSDLISDIHDANIVAKAIRIEKIELASHIEKMGTDKGFISSAERKRREKQKYNQKKSYISDSKIQTNKIESPSSITVTPMHTELSDQSEIDSVYNNIAECASLSTTTSRLPVKFQEALSSDSNNKFLITHDWNPSIELEEILKKSVDNFKVVKTEFICHNMQDNKKRTSAGWNKYLAGWVKNHLIHVKKQPKHKTRTLEEELNDFDW